MTSSRSSAFTLVEMLVVMGVLTALLALILPAIMKVRAAADRTHCANNLHQIGIALHLYDETNRRLPAGCSYEGGNHPQPHMSWLTRILPYMEESALWLQAEQAFAQEPWFETVPPHTGLGTVVKKYLCIADGRTGKTLGAGLTSYLGVEGTDQFARDGMLFLDSRLRISDAKDGTSHTLLVGERPASADERLGWWYAGWGQDKDGSAEMVLGVREHNVCKQYVTDCPKGPYQYGPGRVDDPCAVFHFWSLHPGGAHFLLVDGSVHFLRYSADPIMPALATRNGGEAVSLPD